MATTDVEHVLDDRQWERLAYGTIVALVHQALDNGDLPAIDNTEFMPSDWHGILPWDISDEMGANQFYDELQKRIEKVMSDLEEEAAKRDG